MKKTALILAVISLVVFVFATACGGASAAPVAQAAAPVQAVQPAQPVQNAPAFAPVCQSGNSCAAPAITDTEPINTFCVKKIPYQNLSLDPGTTFESLDPSGELKCQDSGTVVDGKNIITCTSKQLWKYQLKLTNSACGGVNLASGTGQCQEGYGYDAAQNCCAPLGGGSGGVTVITINMGACPSE